MDIEKLIEQLWSYTYWLGQDGPESHDIHPLICDEAATALSTLQAKYKSRDALVDSLEDDVARLTKELEWKDMVIELAQRKEREAKAELEQVKQDRLGWLSPICIGCPGKTADGKRTELCGEPDDLELCMEQSKRLRDLAQADREGRCGIPPVKMHQKIFRVFNEEIYEEIVCNVIWEPLKPYSRWKVFTMTGGLPYFWHEVFGKTVFLSRAEATAALRREQDEKGGDSE